MTRDRMRGLLSGAPVIVLAGSVSLSGQSAPLLPVHTVRIDAIAEDARGQLVDDLKAADFELREADAARSLESAHRRLDGPRIVAIYLDEYHVSKNAATGALRGALARFIGEALGPKDLLVVMKPLDSLLAIRLTEEREAAHASIERFEGRKGEYEPRNAYERNFIAGTPARIEAARTQVALSALNALAIHLGTAGAGRKALIVISEGLARPERRRGEFMPTLETVGRSANRANVAVYTIDPRGDSAGNEPASQALRALAADTNGQSLVGDLDAGLRRIAAELSGYYLLTYQAAHAEDGKFHEVQVKVKRPGIRLRARRGFWAPSPDDVLRAALLARANEPPKPPTPLQPMRRVSPLIRPWFGLARGDEGRTRVTVVWEPAPRVHGDRSRPVASRVMLTALGADGTALFEGPLMPTGPGVIEEVGSPPTRAVFDAAPGRLRLRMSIQDAVSEVLDSDVRDLVVADFRRDLAIGTPLVLRARNARELRLLAGEAATPVASRDFSRAEHLLIRFPVYGPAGATPVLTAKLISRLGSTLRELPIAPAVVPGGPNQIDLPLAGLAAGEYVIDITATSPAGEAKDRIGFRVTS
jgi:VWFA-related protein